MIDFKRRREHVDDARTGKPATVTTSESIEIVYEMIMNDLQLTTRYTKLQENITFKSSVKVRCSIRTMQTHKLVIAMATMQDFGFELIVQQPF